MLKGKEMKKWISQQLKIPEHAVADFSFGSMRSLHTQR